MKTFKTSVSLDEHLKVIRIGKVYIQIDTMRRKELYSKVAELSRFLLLHSPARLPL